MDTSEPAPRPRPLARLARYAESHENLAGLAGAVLGLLPPLAGAVPPGLWWLAPAGYLIGALLAAGLWPTPGPVVRAEPLAAEVAELRARQNRLVDELWVNRRRLPAEALPPLERVTASLDWLLAEPERLAGRPDELAATQALLVRDLPTIFRNYHRLPHHLPIALGPNGTTAAQELAEQLGAVGDRLESVVRRVADDTVQDTIVQRLDLEARARAEDPPGPGGPPPG
ncbi:hypothetical protein [Allonocardiopsis opalescens]|uniref:Uncharacterized protein n=1 Tax=Allonocardiopsis opalescens TaxID=1144618 RepID=A0A2T0Q9J7_9ACTN|nr:hypothetical protein [Allonocardiopsis opalescens]PRY00534.1 hypothetical protein CLV72_102165 [Allonocardiopsis opalescens]